MGPSWGRLGAFLDRLGPSWGRLGPSWGRLGPSWAVLGPSWGRLGPSWGCLGPSWGRLGAVLGRLGREDGYDRRFMMMAEGSRAIFGGCSTRNGHFWGSRWRGSHSGLGGMGTTWEPFWKVKFRISQRSPARHLPLLSERAAGLKTPTGRCTGRPFVLGRTSMTTRDGFAMAPNTLCFLYRLRAFRVPFTCRGCCCAFVFVVGT